MIRLGCCGAWAVLAVVDAADTSEALGDRYLLARRILATAQQQEAP